MRFASVAFGLVSTFVIAGCPGSLANPDDFIDGGAVPKDAQTVLDESCATAGCHDDVTSSAGLDLLSPGVEGRLVGINAKGTGCESRFLVVAGDSNGSYLFEKVLGEIGICDSRMPLLSILPDSDIEVLRDWIDGLGGSGGGTLDGG
jgi:hypothetical protein